MSVLAEWTNGKWLNYNQAFSLSLFPLQINTIIITTTKTTKTITRTLNVRRSSSVVRHVSASSSWPPFAAVFTGASTTAFTSTASHQRREHCLYSILHDPCRQRLPNLDADFHATSVATPIQHGWVCQLSCLSTRRALLRRLCTVRNLVLFLFCLFVNWLNLFVACLFVVCLLFVNWLFLLLCWYHVRLVVRIQSVCTRLSDCSPSFIHACPFLVRWLYIACPFLDR